MKEVLQEGTTVKVPAAENRTLASHLLGSGSAKKAAREVAPSTRRSRMDAVEQQAVGYAKGGMVMATKCKPYKMGK